MAIEGIHHTAISTKDIERLKKFYRDVIGFEVVYEGGWDTPLAEIDAMMGCEGVVAQVAMMRTGTGFLELFQFASPIPAELDPHRPVVDHGFTHIALIVTDMAHEYQRLLAAGMEMHCPPIEIGLPLTGTYGRDPDGNVIELLEIFDENWAFHFANRRLSSHLGKPGGTGK